MLSREFVAESGFVVQRLRVFKNWLHRWFVKGHGFALAGLSLRHENE
jgi:hypothetical protein